MSSRAFRGRNRYRVPQMSQTAIKASHVWCGRATAGSPLPGWPCQGGSTAGRRRGKPDRAREDNRAARRSQPKSPFVGTASLTRGSGTLSVRLLTPCQPRTHYPAGASALAGTVMGVPGIPDREWVRRLGFCGRSGSVRLGHWCGGNGSNGSFLIGFSKDRHLKKWQQHFGKTRIACDLR